MPLAAVVVLGACGDESLTGALGAVGETLGDTEGAIAEVGGTELEAEVETESEFESEFETETGFETETEFESEFEVDAETEFETETETEFEAETETEFETEPETQAETESEVATTPESLPPADLDLLTGPPYLMWVTQTEVSVRWETTVPLVGRVDYGPDDTLGFSVSEPSARTTHELRLTGLPPANDNSYRVVFDGGALPLRQFRTAPPSDSTDAFRFIVWGDNQNGPTTFDDLVLWMGSFDPDFALSVGDCVQNGTRAEYRSQLFNPMLGFGDQVPFLVAAGNHERYSDPDASLFAEYFSQPGDEHCFGWRYGGLFVLVLDTDLGLDGPTGQRACIESQLASAAAQTAKIQAVTFHKPPRIEFWFGGYLAFTDNMEAPWVRNDLEPLLESYGVDIVFNGHNHLYSYTPVTPGGITWVTTGGGGGQLDTPGFLGIWRVGTWPQIQKTISEYHFLSVTMDGSELAVEAIDIHGDVLDAFTVSGD